MTECGRTDDVLKKCIEDVLSVIKPTEHHEKLRHAAIKEISDCISSVETLTGAVVKPYGSFLSKHYAVSGDLDISVELPNNSDSPRKLTTKEEKQDVLAEVWKALVTKGIYRDENLNPSANVPILQYVSKKVEISCDVSVDNYPGLIKSKVLEWINKLDGRFGDMVLLVKEWAKSQGINDPKDGTLNSYSLCLLVVYHLQTCEPPILPPLKEIYDLNTKCAAEYCEENLDKVCNANIVEFQLRNTKPRNESSLSHLFATFFLKIPFTNTSQAISTFEGCMIKNDSYWLAKPPTLLIHDPFETPGNAARAVTSDKIQRIMDAFDHAKSVFVLDGRVADRNELLSLMCTSEVGKSLGVTTVARPSAMSQSLQSILEQELVQEKDHLHRADDLAPKLRFLHTPKEDAEDDD